MITCKMATHFRTRNIRFGRAGTVREALRLPQAPSSSRLSPTVAAEKTPSVAINRYACAEGEKKTEVVMYYLVSSDRRRRVDRFLLLPRHDDVVDAAHDDRAARRVLYPNGGRRFRTSQQHRGSEPFHRGSRRTASAIGRPSCGASPPSKSPSSRADGL